MRLPSVEFGKGSAVSQSLFDKPSTLLEPKRKYCPTLCFRDVAFVLMQVNTRRLLWGITSCGSQLISDRNYGSGRSIAGQPLLWSVEYGSSERVVDLGRFKATKMLNILLMC